MAGDESYDEHGEVRAWLAAEPAPRMPDDVAARLHATLAEESRLRTEGTAPGSEAHAAEPEPATVTPLRRPGRWKAPLLAAAAVVAVIAVAVPVIDQASEESAGDAAKGSSVRAGDAPDTMGSEDSGSEDAAPMLQEPSLSRADFDAGVREQFSRADLEPSPGAASLRITVECADGVPSSAHGHPVTLDGDPAVLLAARSTGVVPGIEVRAVVCGADGPEVAARTTLPDR